MVSLRENTFGFSRNETKIVKVRGISDRKFRTNELYTLCVVILFYSRLLLYLEFLKSL